MTAGARRPGRYKRVILSRFALIVPLNYGLRHCREERTAPRGQRTMALFPDAECANSRGLFTRYLVKTMHLTPVLAAQHSQTPASNEETSTFPCFLYPCEMIQRDTRVLRADHNTKIDRAAVNRTRTCLTRLACLSTSSTCRMPCSKAGTWFLV